MEKQMRNLSSCSTLSSGTRSMDKQDLAEVKGEHLYKSYLLIY